MNSPVSISFGFYLHGVIDVAAHITNVHTFGAKQVAIAGDVAVGDAVMLGMTPSSQGLPAPLAPQTGSVPISAQRHHLLSKIDGFLTTRAQRGLPSERLHVGRAFLALGEARSGPGGAEAAGAEGGDAGRDGSWGSVEVGAHTTNVHPPGSKKNPIAWLVAIRPSVVLCMPSWGQDVVAVLTFQAEAVPVLAQGAHLLCKENGLQTTGADPAHGSMR